MKTMSYENKTPHRAYKDPTADMAIGNIMREEKKKEKDIEKAFVDAVFAAGGVAMKFTSQTANGVPDRIVLMFPGKCAFVELKAPGKMMRPLQRKRRQQLEELGFPVFCIDRLSQIKPAIEALKNWNPGEPFPEGIGAKIPEIETVTLPLEGGKSG